MKITIVGPVYPYRGGIAHFTTSLAEETIKAGHTLEVISFKRQYPGILYPGKTDRDPSRDKIEVSARFILDPFYPWTWSQASKWIIHAKPDLVVIQWWTTFWGLALGSLARLLRKAGIRVVYLIHNVVPHETRFYDKSLARFALAGADLFITLSESQNKRLEQFLPEKSSIISAHPTYRFGELQKTSKPLARQRLNIPLDRKVVLFFGIIRPYKGVKGLIKALGTMKRAGQPVHLIIAGEAWDDISAYHRLIEEEGLTDWVSVDNRYIPNEDLPDLFGAADVFAAPYESGTQSGAVKLAIGYHLPMMITPVIADEALKSRVGKGVFIAASANPEDLKVGLENTLQYTPEPDAAEEADKSWEILLNTIIGLAEPQTGEPKKG